MTPVARLAPPAACVEPVRWSAVTYRVPARTSAAVRVGLWRQLQRAGALNLELGAWGVAHDERGEVDLTEVEKLVANAGGRCSVREVPMDDGGDGRDRQLADLLVRACGRLWDPFFNEADELVERLALADPGERPADALDGLRGAFVAVRRRDVLFAATGRRAARRLEQAAALVDPSAAPTPADEVFSRTISGRPPFPVRPVGHALADGTARYLATVRPLVPLAWERAFTAFEAEVYLPDEDRIPLVHGAFSFRTTPDDVGVAVDGLTRRLQTFARAWS